jgi:hypothetical protein
VKSDDSDPQASKFATQDGIDMNNFLPAHSTMAAVILLFLLSLHDTQTTMVAFSFFFFSGGMNEEQMFNGLARTVVTPQKAQTMALLFSFVRLRIHGGQRPSLHRE